MPRNATQQLYNDDMRNGYFGPYRVFDIANLLSANHDNVTWQAKYNLGDSVHYIAAAQAEIDRAFVAHGFLPPGASQAGWWGTTARGRLRHLQRHL